jgi:uncharacterized protein with LGFP repeats
LEPVVESVNGNGKMQRFQNGIVHSSAAGTFAIFTPMMTKYSAAKWVRGYLGWPIAAAVCSSGGECTQAFSGGTLTTP